MRYGCPLVQQGTKFFKKHNKLCKLPLICFPGGSEVKVSTWNVVDPGSIPGSGRSPGEGNGNPLQYSCPGESHGGRSLGRLLSMGSQRVRHD